MAKKNSFYLAYLFFLFGTILILSNSFFSLATELPKNEKSNNSVMNTISTVNEEIVNVKLSFIGDSLLASFKGEKYSMNFQDLLENTDYSFPYKNVSNIFKDDDYTIANGENVFTDKILAPVEKNHSPAFWYYSNTKYANIYKESSIEIVSVMNNHSYDYGNTGYTDTKDALKNANVIVGAEEPVIISKDGVKIALLCINLFHRFQYQNALSDIKKIRNDVNYIIVYFHGGIEYLYAPSAEIIEYSHGFIDNGADLVIGCHPHVLEPREIYKDKKIVYSLGSFLFGGTKTLVNRTIIYQMNLNFNITKNEIIEKEKIIPCYLYSGKPGYDSWIPDVIENEHEKRRVIDFMNGLLAKPI